MSKLHADAGNDLTRAFLNITPKQQQPRIEDPTINDDVSIYEGTDDLFHPTFLFPENEESSNHSDDNCGNKLPTYTDLRSVSSSEFSVDEVPNLDSSLSDDIFLLEDESRGSGTPSIVGYLSSGDETDDEVHCQSSSDDEARGSGTSSVGNNLFSDDGADDEEHCTSSSYTHQPSKRLQSTQMKFCNKKIGLSSRLLIFVVHRETGHEKHCVSTCM